MNKKATLLMEEVLKIIVAVICLGFLIFLLISLYFAATGAQNKKEAEESMKDVLSKEIESINSGGEFKEQGIRIPNPSSWYIFSFVGEENKPNLCTSQNCVCICENVRVNLFNWQKRQVERCDDKGSCVVVSNLKKFEKIKIENSGTALFVRKVNDEIEITRK